MTYQKLYPFEVLSAIQDGKCVYILDKETASICCAENLIVRELARIAKDATENTDRYLFWYVEERKETET